jgi:hypothetical protein
VTATRPEPTDADTAAALAALGPTYTGATVARVAAALAAERDRTRQPYLDLADQWEATSRDVFRGPATPTDRVIARTTLDAAALIRDASQ